MSKSIAQCLWDDDDDDDDVDSAAIDNFSDQNFDANSMTGQRDFVNEYLKKKGYETLPLDPSNWKQRDVVNACMLVFRLINEKSVDPRDDVTASQLQLTKSENERMMKVLRTRERKIGSLQNTTDVLKAENSEMKKELAQLKSRMAQMTANIKKKTARYQQDMARIQKTKGTLETKVRSLIVSNGGKIPPVQRSVRITAKEQTSVKLLQLDCKEKARQIAALQQENEALRTRFRCVYNEGKSLERTMSDVMFQLPIDPFDSQVMPAMMALFKAKRAKQEPAAKEDFKSSERIQILQKRIGELELELKIEKDRKDTEKQKAAFFSKVVEYTVATEDDDGFQPEPEPELIISNQPNSPEPPAEEIAIDDDLLSFFKTLSPVKQ